MIVLAFVRTFAIAAPIEPVVSDRKTMSGFGGIGGVWTVLVIVTLEPDGSAALNEGGLTPVLAEAGPATNRDVRAADATPIPTIRFLIRFSPLIPPSRCSPTWAMSVACRHRPPARRWQVSPPSSTGPIACSR